MRKSLWIIGLLYSLIGLAQENLYNKFIHVFTSDGLSQSSVIAFEQDDLGRMWIGTRDGLNVYNGHDFKVFRNIPGDSTSISNNDILAIKQDGEGYIWVGTYYGLNRYDPELNTFTSYIHSNEKGSIIDNTIWDIEVTKSGELWIASSGGLMRYSKDSDSFESFTTKKSKGILSNKIKTLHEDDSQNLWVGTENGLFKMVPEKEGKLVFQKIPFQNNKSTSPLIVQTITTSPEGTLLVGSKNQGLLSKTQTQAQLTYHLPIKDRIKMNKDIRSILFDDLQNLWIATYNGLYLKKDNGDFISSKHLQGNSYSLSRNTLKTLFKDKKGSIWIGSYYGGINIWDPSNSNFISLSKNTDQKDTSYGVVSCMLEDQNKKIYFGTEGKGISILQPDHTTVELTALANQKLPGNNIKSLYLDKNKLWIGTYMGGVVTFNTKSNQLDLSPVPKELNQFIKEMGVYAITGFDDYLFFGTFGNGLVKYHKPSQNFEIIQHHSLDHNSLSDNRIRVLYIDQQENLWVGTQNGLNRIKLNPATPGKIKVDRFLFNQEQLSGDDILSIYQTKKRQNLYIGTKANGLYTYENEKFQKMELNYLDTHINTIFGILYDEKQNLWISSNEGIAKYDLEHSNTTLYNQKDGLLGNEFNNNSSLRSSDGNLYFGGPSGVSFIDPLHLAENKYAPQVILTGLRIQGKPVDDYGKDKVLSKDISYSEEIVFDHDQSSFSIEFAIPNFINSNNNKYAYRLVGLDEQWRYTSSNRANYTLQKPGSYTFEVKGANNDNIWNTDPTQLKIKVKPTPWRSPLAFAGYASVIILALIGFGNISKAKTKLKHKLELEHLEKEQQELMNKSKLEFFTNISHEFRTPLALILGPLQNLIEEYQGSAKMYRRLLVIERNADQLLKLINQLLDFRKFETKHSTLEAAEGDIVKYLKEIYLSFNEHAKIGKYRYTFESSQSQIRLHFDRFKLEKVFYNIISNAFKYTPDGGEIHLKVTQKDQEVWIDVEDNGKGIDKAFVEKVFDRFYEISADKNYQKQFNQASGIGLSIAKKIIDLHKGEIKILDTKAQGTTFRVILKLGTDHLEENQIIKNFKISDDLSQYVHQKEEIITTPKELFLETQEESEDRHTVLIAEDNDELRYFIADLLREKYNVVEAEDGKIAFKKALLKSPDLIVSDVIMPNMEGTELCAKIKSDIRTSHIPFILLTSRTSLIYKYNGLESGADAYINKPFNVKEFLLTIKNQLENSERLKEKFANSNFKSENYTVPSIDEELLKKAIQIVEENMDNTSFDIPFFSSELGVSRTMLFTKIKAWTNLTPNEFIHSIRMKRASQLLELGQINVSEVCYKVGFRNPKYFTKCFKKHFDQTPSDYAAKFYQ